MRMAPRNLPGTLLLAALALGSLSFHPPRAPDGPPAPPYRDPQLPTRLVEAFELPDGGLEPAGCLGAPPCEDARQILVDYSALGLDGAAGAEGVTYDYAEATRPLRKQDLADESELSLVVRLILSEVGADRLLVNRYGLLEAIGILHSVDNRLDPLAYNPEDQPGAPTFPGCGADGALATCANAQQYLGMDTWRALTPTLRYRAELLEQAVDVAVLAWWLQDRGLVEDFTGGATNYVHRCGGTGYGKVTYHCDGRRGGPYPELRDANPATGPLVFFGPSGWSERKGRYGLYTARLVDYAPWWDDQDSERWASLGLRPDELLRMEGDDGLVLLVDELEGSLDGPTLERLRR